MIRAAVIGCGSIAKQRHAHELSLRKDVEIAGFFDFVTERAADLAATFGGKVYSSVDELLDDESVDLVSVCVANAYHAEVSVKALRKGKHVLCEKPMAISEEDCQSMIEAARESGKRLFIRSEEHTSELQSRI